MSNSHSCVSSARQVSQLDCAILAEVEYVELVQTILTKLKRGRVDASGSKLEGQYDARLRSWYVNGIPGSSKLLSALNAEVSANATGFLNPQAALKDALREYFFATAEPVARWGIGSPEADVLAVEGIPHSVLNINGQKRLHYPLGIVFINLRTGLVEEYSNTQGALSPVLL